MNLFKKIALLLILTNVAFGVEIHEDVKFMAKSSVYGVIGGTLVGVAGLAFDLEFRDVPKSAALGLYAGLLYVAYRVYRRDYGSNDFRYSYVPKNTIIELPLYTMSF